jgi:hypothetical protein
MDNLYINIVPHAQISAVVSDILEKAFQLTTPNSQQEPINRLEEFLKEARPGFFCCVEYPYVDKLYRNEYYYFFSSKLYDYKRDCIRLSFFSAEIKNEDFRNQDRQQFLQDHYLGFLVIRPTFPALIGRNVLSPKFFNNPLVAITFSPYCTSINGVKLIICGFPHASQDREMMVCAETTIWSVMEYFSHRYPEYKPVLPDEIHKILNRYSPQRLVPSNGLNLLEICYALKQLAFGVRIYSRDVYGVVFDNILKTYVESGIPVVAAIENQTGIAHVVNIIGRENQPQQTFAVLIRQNIEHGASISNYLDLYNNYVLIDDNFPAYRIVPLNNPAIHYAANPQWNGCAITNFIVPLYPKIYLEADTAVELSKNLFVQLNKQTKIVAGKHYSLRTLLSSSRSFKNAVAHNLQMNTIVKEKLLNTSMPKFVWITELISDKDASQNMASGIILLDATERRENEFLAFYLESIYLSSEKDGTKQINGLALQSFSSFYNLKPY